MICNNCGAEYDGNLNACPYCGFENSELVKADFEKNKEKLYEENRNMEKLPSKISKKASRVLIKSALVFIVLFITVLLICSVYFHIVHKNKKNSEVENTEHFEQLLADRDYETLSLEVSDLPFDYLSYDKYREIMYAYWDYQSLVCSVDSYYKFKDAVSEQLVSELRINIMKDLHNTFANIDECINDSELLNNDDYLLDIKKMSEDLFLSVFPESEELVDEIMNIDDSIEDDKLFENLDQKFFKQQEKVK